MRIRIIKLRKTVMRIAAGLVLAMIPLLIQGCTKTGNAEGPVPSQLPAAQKPVMQTVTPTPSEDAAAIGITAENYPRIDGSTSTLPLVQRIYKRMFLHVDGGGDGWPGLPQKASKTMRSYEMLIAGDVDLILVPDPSQEIRQMAESSGTELEYIPIGAEALVFVTHKDNIVNNITASQVQREVAISELGALKTLYESP